MSLVTVRVRQHNDPTLAFTGTQKRFGAKTPYDFTDVTEIEFYMKADAETDDAAAIAVYRLTTGEIEVVEPKANGRCLVQGRAEHFGVADTFWFHLDAIKNGRRETIAYGPLIVEDV